MVSCFGMNRARLPICCYSKYLSSKSIFRWQQQTSFHLSALSMGFFFFYYVQWLIQASDSSKQNMKISPYPIPLNAGFQRSVCEGNRGKQDKHAHCLLGRSRSFRNFLCGALAHLALHLGQMENQLLCIIIALQVTVLTECEGSVL